MPSAADEPLLPTQASSPPTPGDGLVAVPHRAEPAAPAQEIDVWWGAYSGWTMLPSYAVCVLLTVGVVVMAWFLAGDAGLNGDTTRYTVYAVAGSIWTAQLLRWGYRFFAFNYRLTTRRLFCFRGFLYAALAPLPLFDIRHVQLEQTGTERWLNVGRIRVQGEKETLLLVGVPEPKRIVAMIERCLREARGC